MMKREILFRGKRIDNGEWVSSGNLITFTDEGEGRQFFIPQVNAKCTCAHDAQDNIISFDSGMFYKVDPDTVGQFTGLTDKNGKKIFEGDIVRDSYNSVGIVEFGTGTFDSGVYCYTGWHRRERDGCIDHTELHDYGWPKEFEVIGNIHDNPEMLGGGEDG